MSGSTLLSKDGAELLTRDAPKCKDVRAEGEGGGSLVRREPCVCACEKSDKCILKQEVLPNFFKLHNDNGVNLAGKYSDSKFLCR